MEDKIVVRIDRDGSLQAFELSGLLTLRITDEKLARIKVEVQNNDAKGIQLQTHPNVDKELFKTRGLIGLKNSAKPFPLNTDVGVLKWRWQTQDESSVPLTSKHCRIKTFFRFSLITTSFQSTAGLPRMAKVVVMLTSNMNWSTSV